MEPFSRKFSFVTAGFPHGAYQTKGRNIPEVRVPSIRGHLRWWFDALAHDAGVPDTRESDRIFGHVGDDAHAGKVIVRVEEWGAPRMGIVPFIPHKRGDGGRKKAIKPSSSYLLHIASRRGAVDAADAELLKKSVDAWLLLGSIGQRSNRGAGSLTMEGAPSTEQEFLSWANEQLGNGPIRVALLSREYRVDNEELLRFNAGDFLASDAFASEGCLTPFGSSEPRKPSNLKLKGVPIDGHLRLLAIWDSRHQTDQDLRQGVSILIEGEKTIGTELSKVLDILAPAQS